MLVAVILPHWIGDAVMATPMLRSLAAHIRGRGRIIGVMRPVIADLLAGTPWVDEVVPYDRGRARQDPTVGYRGVLRRLRESRVDMAVISPNSFSSAALAFAAAARRRVGHVGHWRRLLLTDVAAAPSDGPLPPPASFMELAVAAGADRGPLDVELATTPDEERLAERVLADLFGPTVAGDGPLVILNDNGAHGPARTWGIDKSAALARWLAERIAGCRVLMHCGPADRESAREVAARANLPTVRSLADVPDLPIGLSKALFRRAALAVSSDSGPRHIAAAFGVPTVALVGPVDPRFGRSDERRCTELRADLPCSPCNQPACPLHHHDCMRLLTVDQVGQAALVLWERFRGEHGWPAAARGLAG
jgi:heptosyltransferase-2